MPKSPIETVLAAQDPIIQQLMQSDVEHGVLIPLKTTLELRDDHVTGRVLITRAPVKAANPAIRYGHPPPPLLSFVLSLYLTLTRLACCAISYLRKSLRAFLIFDDVPSRATCPPTSRHNS